LLSESKIYNSTNETLANSLTSVHSLQTEVRQGLRQGRTDTVGSLVSMHFTLTQRIAEAVLLNAGCRGNRMVVSLDILHSTKRKASCDLLNLCVCRYVTL